MSQEATFRWGARVAATDGDLERRFAEFVASHRDRARRLAFRLTADEAAADDVTQDALVRAYTGLSRFRGDAKLETWFYRILVRQAHNHRRWRGVRDAWSSLTAPDEIGRMDPAPGDPQLRSRVEQALGGLSTLQRETFVLVHLEGFTVKETAEFLGKAEGTVKSHLHRALRVLREQLADLRDPVDAPGSPEQGSRK